MSVFPHSGADQPINAKTRTTLVRVSALSVRKLSILTGARPATFDVSELDVWVRYVSRYYLAAIVSLLSLKSLRMILHFVFDAF